MQLQPSHLRSRSAASLLVVGALLLITHPAFAGDRANYVEVSAWDTGYQAEYKITNDGPGSLTTWTISFDLPSGSSISSSWDSVRSGTGQHLIFDSASWNGTLAPGESTTFGFVVVGTGRPVSCKINGGPCDTFPPLAPPADEAALAPSAGRCVGRGGRQEPNPPSSIATLRATHAGNASLPARATGARFAFIGTEMLSCTRQNVASPSRTS